MGGPCARRVLHHQSGSQTPPNTIWAACPLPHSLLGKPPTGELDYRLAGWFPGLTSRTQRTCTLGQLSLTQMVGVSRTYVSKIENEKLDFGDYPSEELIIKIAAALEADEDELLILAKESGSGCWNDRMRLAGWPSLMIRRWIGC